MASRFLSIAMNSISNKEVERQYRVLRQNIEMHAMLRDEYYLKARFSLILLLLCSVVFCATTFASDQLFETLKFSPEISRTILGIASVMAFSFSLILIVFDWRGKSAQHRDAVNRWSAVLEKFRRHRTDEDTWPDSTLDGLSTAYWEADRNSVKIPNNRFNRLKSRHLRKVAISKLKSSYPACPRLVLFFILFFRDSYCAISECFKSNAETNRP